MNREIKFRAFIKHLKWMVPVERICFDCETIEVDLTAGNGDTAEYNFDEFELMQYTGLKDKNGKEIYEGDIVKYKFAFYRDISKVEFNQDIAAFDMVSIKELDSNSSMRVFKKGSRRGFNKNLVAGYDYVEVIGNIYENKELLQN